MSAFCAYAAFGILGLYGLVSTFFVACLTLDQRRVEQSRDAIFFCFIHRDYIPNKFSQMNLVQSFIEKVYSPTLMKLSCKVCTINFVVSLLIISVTFCGMFLRNLFLFLIDQGRSWGGPIYIFMGVKSFLAI